MVIRTEIDIEKMRDCILDSIEFAEGEDSYNAKVPIPLLYDVIDVLEETLRREQKHQTLESELTFIEKEDGTQKNLMEEHNKKPECFGKYDEDYLDCLMCMCGDECLKETKNKEQNK